MRHPDLPKFKNEIMKMYVGKLIGFLENEGLVDGQEFACTLQNESYLIPRYYIHVFDNNKNRKHQLVVVFNPIMMEIEYGVATKKPRETIYRQKLKNLRYKISDGEELDFIDTHKKKVNIAFSEIKKIFKLLKEKDEFKNSHIENIKENEENNER